MAAAGRPGRRSAADGARERGADGPVTGGGAGTARRPGRKTRRRARPSLRGAPPSPARPQPIRRRPGPACHAPPSPSVGPEPGSSPSRAASHREAQPPAGPPSRAGPRPERGGGRQGSLLGGRPAAPRLRALRTRPECVIREQPGSPGGPRAWGSGKVGCCGRGGAGRGRGLKCAPECRSRRGHFLAGVTLAPNVRLLALRVRMALGSPGHSGRV